MMLHFREPQLTPLLRSRATHTRPQGIALDPTGRLFVADTGAQLPGQGLSRLSPWGQRSEESAGQDPFPAALLPC